MLGTTGYKETKSAFFNLNPDLKYNWFFQVLRNVYARRLEEKKKTNQKDTREREEFQ